jgi:hypothetical protein
MKKVQALREKDLVELTLDKRNPETEKERKLQKQIAAIKKKGWIVEIPKEFI